MATDEENAVRLTRTIQSFGFPMPAPGLLRTPGKLIRMGDPPLRIELLTSISGRDFDDCYGRRSTARIDEIDVPMLALTDLVRNKQASGRLRDQVDVQHLSRGGTC